ncbi:MAG: TonB family protein [Terracidiphilus sp.]
MMDLLNDGERLERELTPEPIAAPAMGSLLLHGILAGGLFAYAIIGGLFHHNLWGSAGAGGAIQVNLVSSALPLPSDHPPNENVLSTETPSEAPAAPSPKAKQAVDETAIPIAGKQKKPQQQTAPKTQQHQPQPKQENRAQYGEQAGSSMPRSMQSQTGSNGPTAVSNGDFGSRFGWYVDGITRKMDANWYRQEVDPRTPKGTRCYIIFVIHRDGSVSNVQMDRSSGSPTLDRSCIRAAQRVDTFGALPSQYNMSTVNVSHYCEY